MKGNRQQANKADALKKLIFHHKSLISIAETSKLLERRVSVI